MRYIQLGIGRSSLPITITPNPYWELPAYASEQETMKTADRPESKAAYRWFAPAGPGEGLWPATIAGAGRRERGSDGP